MIAILSFLLLGYAAAETVTMKWAKDAGLSPVYHEEDDGSLTVEYPIFEGTYEQIEPIRRRLQALTDYELRKLLLDKHNELRSTTARGLAPCGCSGDKYCGSGHQGAGYHPGAKNMNKLNWDYALEVTAQSYSDKCAFIHNDNRGSEAFGNKRYSQWTFTKQKDTGENLYISSTGERVWNNFFGDKDYGLEGGLYGWWIECEDYNLETRSSCGGQVGHYTQYIRADARYVGCGVTICPNGVVTKTSSYSWANLNVVCNYFGGQFGDTPYEIATTANEVASNCEPDRTPNTATGLCEGPMIKDYFFNPQSSYDLTTRGGSNWICNDGTTDGSATTGWLSEASAKEGRQLNYCDASKTPQPTPYPTATTTTKRPTNPPVTPRPTPDPTTVPPTPAPVDAPTPQPVENVVTARPTKKQPTPQPLEPSTSSTMKPTSFPTTSTTTTPAPVPTTAECSIQDCTFDVKVEWVSEAQVYQGFANYVWNRQKQLTGLANKGGWRAGYSWGGNYRKNAKNNWELYIYDDVGTDFSEMECTWRDVLIAYMRDGEQGGDEGTEGGTYFKDAMKSLILSDMTDAYGSNPGYVDAVTVVVTCTTTDAAAFGAIDEDGNIELPFSTWNLNTYDFSDWFVLLFVLFTGCACCFGCGWAMHRRRVFKAMDDASISDFNANPEAPMVTMDGNASPQNITTTDDYHNATYATNEPEIEIGVSVNSNNHGIMAEDSE